MNYKNLDLGNLAADWLMIWNLFLEADSVGLKVLEKLIPGWFDRFWKNRGPEGGIF